MNPDAALRSFGAGAGILRLCSQDGHLHAGLLLKGVHFALASHCSDLPQYLQRCYWARNEGPIQLPLRRRCANWPAGKGSDGRHA
jgi:hypothetical protein